MNIRAFLPAIAIFSSSICLGQTKLRDLNIDTTITGFHFAANFQGTMVFTKNGAPDIQTINPTAFSFTIATGMTFDEAKDQLEQLLNMSVQNGYKITGLIKRDTTLNGYNAYYISYTETHESNYKNYVFNSYVIKDKTLILFTSGDLDNGLYIDKFRKTFYSIKL